MIIISRRKDYYDYLVGVYGRDEKKVFNRRSDITSKEILHSDFGRYRNLNIYDLIICNRIYRVEQVKEGEWELHKFHSVDTNYKGERRHYRESQVSDLKDFEYFIPKPPNMDVDSPIAIRGTYHKEYRLDGLTPILSTFGIPSVLGAEELYSEIDMYISNLMSQEEDKGEQSDKNKLLSKGFDDKTSFRHRK